LRQPSRVSDLKSQLTNQEISSLNLYGAETIIRIGYEDHYNRIPQPEFFIKVVKGIARWRSRLAPWYADNIVSSET
jgi:hypothetical protein